MNLHDRITPKIGKVRLKRFSVSSISTEKNINPKLIT